MRKRITREQYHKAGNGGKESKLSNEAFLDKTSEDMQSIIDVTNKVAGFLKNNKAITKQEAMEYVEFKNKMRRAYDAFIMILSKMDNKLASKYADIKTVYYNAMLTYEKAIDDMLPFVKFSSTCIQADALLKVYIGSAGRQAIRRVMSFLRRPRHSLYGMGAAGGGGLAYGRYRQKKQHAPTVNQMTDYESGVKPHALNRHNRSFE